MKQFKDDYLLIDLTPEKVVVVHDDLDMSPGKVKLKKSSGDGGHNGIKSIISFLNSKDFFRVKIGIGKPLNKLNIAEYVLSNFSIDEEKSLKKSYITAANRSIILALSNNLNIASNFF